MLCAPRCSDRGGDQVSGARKHSRALPKPCHPCCTDTPWAAGAGGFPRDPAAKSPSVTRRLRSQPPLSRHRARVQIPRGFSLWKRPFPRPVLPRSPRAFPAATLRLPPSPARRIIAIQTGANCSSHSLWQLSDSSALHELLARAVLLRLSSFPSCVPLGGLEYTAHPPAPCP